MLFALMFCGYKAGAQTFPQSERERQLIRLLTQDPSGVSHRFEYAVLLYQRDKLDEALKQINYVLQKNPQSSGAQILKGSIEELRKINYPSLRQKKALDQNMKMLGQALGQIRKATEELRSRVGAVTNKSLKSKTN